MDKIDTMTQELQAKVNKLTEEIRGLKLAVHRTTGEVQQAYHLILGDALWRLTELIGTYWRETLDITNQEERLRHT